MRPITNLFKALGWREETTFLLCALIAVATVYLAMLERGHL